MASKDLTKKMQDELNDCYANEGRLKRVLEELRNQFEDPEINQYEKESLSRMIMAEEINLEKTLDKIDEIRGEQKELSEKEKEAKEFRWKDIQPLVEEAAKKHYMSYCVENNKFVYCMDMASRIKDETGNEFVVVNPQFRMFEATRIQQVVSKLIGKYMTDNQHQLIKWFMTNDGYTHFQATASFMTAKWSSDKVYNKASVISKFWVEPDMINYKDYNKDFDLLIYSVAGGKQENIDHLEQWPLYKYWYPERVANTPNLDICGPLGANGKGRYLEICKTIFTYGCVSPGTSKELSDGFNSSWEMSTLIYFDEPTEKELPHNKVKNVTGGDEQRIEKKGIDSYTADRNYSIMALSNNERGVFQLEGTGMAGQDRRFSVISTDIVLIDEIVKRENCTMEQATIRANEIAQLVKDRKEVAKWMGHIMVKHNIAEMKILRPLHGKDYQKRFEGQKDKLEQIFDKILPIFAGTGAMPVMFLTKICEALLSQEHKKAHVTNQGISSKFTLYLQKHRVDFGHEQKKNIKITFKNKPGLTLEQKSIFYHDKNNIVDTMEFSTLCNDIYHKDFVFTKENINISLD